MNSAILISGFGGQGVLFAGKFLSYLGLLAGWETSWLPSYGPEMRGGTARCGVNLSQTPIGSPIVDKPDILVAMNLPSLDLLEASVVPGGRIFVDSALVKRRIERADIAACYMPVSAWARSEDLEGLGNMMLVGGVLQALGITEPSLIAGAMEKTVPPRKKALIEGNMKALQMGMRFGAECASE